MLFGNTHKVNENYIEWKKLQAQIPKPLQKTTIQL